MSATNAERLVVKGAIGPRFDEILTPEALAFVAELHGRFDAKRRALLEFRNERQVRANLAGVGREMTAADVEFIKSTLR